MLISLSFRVIGNVNHCDLSILTTLWWLSLECSTAYSKNNTERSSHNQKDSFFFFLNSPRACLQSWLVRLFESSLFHLWGTGSLKNVGKINMNKYSFINPLFFYIINISFIYLREGSVKIILSKDRYSLNK